MTQQDIFSQWSSASFMVRSTARRLRLRNFVGGESALKYPWEFLEIQNTQPNVAGTLYAALNGATASSSLGTFTSYLGQQSIVVPARSSRAYAIKATSISAILTGSTAAAVIVFVARYP